MFEPVALAACTPGPGVFCGVESRAVLDNPGQGFESFHKFAAALPLSKHPHARAAYARFWWSELEPEQGVIRFELIDAALEEAAANGQRFSFRVMPEEGSDGQRRVPGWIAEGTWGKTVRAFSPRYDAPQFIEAVERTVAALGARYDADPRIEHVDLGFVGDAGEWAQVVDGSAMPSAQTSERIIAAFAKAFTRTPVLMNVGVVDDGAVPLASALRKGMGWRLDCWGDIRRGWNHHDNFYEQQLTRADAFEVWRHAPVAVETCGEMEAWDLLGYQASQVRWLLRWALEHHVSLINNKSRSVPTRFRPLVDEYLGFAGPRFFVQRATRVGSTLRVELLNRGSTPPYRGWKLQARVRDGAILQGDVSLALVTDAAIATFPVPPTGAVDVTLVDETGAMLQLANAGVSADGWLQVE